ncbi:expressed unknown protein [Ectocarpus siliculosus]|uniref:Uncharacterized protein n=1 Tax=Ectocarpus siliculosus TaxID=2880 RepID=D8LRD7_ECTSI|nr:expressed unknown protein [Ectocarpus siliculosus]|eukprot:CBN75042.1 expressed unknown protein [Ectocarpus siliculosus]
MTLREQLQKLVSQKLAAKGELDHAGLLALETLSKMAPEGEVDPVGGSSAGGSSSVGGVVDSRPRRILPPGIEKLTKFSGKDPGAVSDVLNRFHSLVVAALPGSSPGTVNKALNRDVVFVLEGAALKFFKSLKAGQMEWEPTPPPSLQQRGAEAGAGGVQQQAGKPPFRPPSTWAEVYNAFHDHYLPADGIARTSDTLFSLSQAADESVPTLVQRQMGLTNHLSRLIEANGGQTTFWEAIMIRLFERALRADLQRLQHAEPPCPTFQESVDRADRNALRLEKEKSKRRNDAGEGGGGGERPPEDNRLHHGTRPQDSSSSGAGEGKEGVQSSGGLKAPALVRSSSSSARGPLTVSGTGEDVAPVVGGFLPPHRKRENDAGGGGAGEGRGGDRLQHGSKTQRSSDVGDGKEVVHGWGGLKGAAHARSSSSSSVVRGQLTVPGGVESEAVPVGGFQTRHGRSADRNDGGDRERVESILSDDGSRSTPAWQDEPEEHVVPGGSGEWGDGGEVKQDRSRGSRGKKKSQKRTRDWQEGQGRKRDKQEDQAPSRDSQEDQNRTRDRQEGQHARAQHRPSQPHRRRQPDPDNIPPCTNPGCKARRKTHSSNICFYHPDPAHARRNRMRRKDIFLKNHAVEDAGNDAGNWPHNNFDKLEF